MGRYYYFHTESRQTQWDTPVLEGAGPSDVDSDQVSAQGGEKDAGSGMGASLTNGADTALATGVDRSDTATSE